MYIFVIFSIYIYIYNLLQILPIYNTTDINVYFQEKNTPELFFYSSLEEHKQNTPKANNNNNDIKKNSF
jgi:hypothetical protein